MTSMLTSLLLPTYVERSDCIKFPKHHMNRSWALAHKVCMSQNERLYNEEAFSSAASASEYPFGSPKSEQLIQLWSHPH